MASDAACFDVQSTASVNSAWANLASISRSESNKWWASRIVVQPSILLAQPLDCALNVGLVVDEEVALGSWNGPAANWEWWWIPPDPAPGASFHLPIRQSVAADAFVAGEVRAVDAEVMTPARTFTDAVLVDYVVGLGENLIVDTGGNVLGKVEFEVVGWIAFVPGVGPVKSEEVFGPAEFDCPLCPPVIFESITTSMELTDTSPVAIERGSFGSIKARY